MISRTLTIQGNPNTQIVLYYESRTNAEKVAGIEVPGTPLISYEDDFKQKAVIDSTKIISDLITDINQMFEASGELEIAKMKGAKHLEQRIAADPLLKVWLEMKQREQSQRQRGAMMMPGVQIQQ